MRAGRLNERVTLLERSVARDALGGEIVTWTDRGETWADVTPLRGREYFAAMQVNPEYQIRFRLRYQSAPTITNEWRLEWRGEQYDILDVINVDARDDMLELMCRTAPS